MQSGSKRVACISEIEVSKKIKIDDMTVQRAFENLAAAEAQPRWPP